MTIAVRTVPPLRLTPQAAVTTAVMSLEEIAALAPAWDRLLDGAAYANPFYGRAVMTAHAAHGIGPTARLLIVRQGPDLLALLPVFERRIGLGRAATVGWATPFTTNGTPLLASDGLEDAADALLDGLAGVGRLAMLPLVALDHPVVEALTRAARARGWPWCEIGAFDRPVLERRDGIDACAGEHLSTGRRKGLRRRRSKLAERGEVTFHSAGAGPALSHAIEQFLILERGGWKGARGTALASRAATMGFARVLFGSACGGVAPRADMLCLDGRPIAVSLAIVCRGTAYLLKTTFDESLRAYAPGIVLEAEIVRACHEERFAARLDSASLPGSVFDHLYPDRERIGDLLLATSADVSASALQHVANTEVLRRRAMKRLKQLYSRVTGRR